MKIISQPQAIATLLVVPDEVKPLKGYHLPQLIKAVGARYEFGKFPTAAEVISSGAKFQQGRLKSVNIPELGIFNDGFIATTSSDTSDSEVVLNDLVAFLKETFGFRDPQT